MKTKICTKCKVRKPLTKFYKCSYKGKQYYRGKCKDCIGISNKVYRTNNKGKTNATNKKWRVNHPWVSNYMAASNRCNNPKHKKYKYYGGRGIQLLMNIADFKKLWFRDKAYLMKEPSIDRKDSNGNYTLNNCRFVEKIDNV